MIIMININEDFIKNVKNIKLINSESNNYLSCLYNNNEALIIIIYSHESINNLSSFEKDNYFFPIIYNTGIIDFNLLLEKNFIIEIKQNINDLTSDFRDIIDNILNNNTNTIITDDFINYCNHSKNNKLSLQICKLLINYNKKINIIIQENVLIYNNLLDNKNIINKDLFQIFYLFLYSIFFFKNKLNIQKFIIIKNDKYNNDFLNLDNEYSINKKYRIIFKEFNSNLSNNNAFELLNYFIFHISKFIPEPNNFFKSEIKIIKSLNKILFKNNKDLRFLIYTKQLFLTNNINDSLIDKNIFNINHILKNKYLINKLVNNNILILRD